MFQPDWQLCVAELDITTDAWAAPPPHQAAPSDFCIIMFTSGSTGVPKAVPLTHIGMCWLFETKLQAEAEFYPADHGGTMCFLPHYHVMGFCMNWLFNLSAGVRAFALSDAALASKAAVSPSLLIEAVAARRPSVLTTVPAIADAIADLTEQDPGRTAPLTCLNYILCGGARLSAHKVECLARNGIRVRSNMGATELGGVLLLGVPGDASLRMRPMPGVTYRLEALDDGDSAHESEALRVGVLVYNGALSVTPGYIIDGAVQPTTLSAHASYDSRDVCMEQEGEWLLHQYRVDDLLLHSTGEKTNPISVEGLLHKALGGLCVRLCIVGTGLLRPVLLVELSEQAVADCSTTAAELRRVIVEANGTLPTHSRLIEEQTLIIDPRSQPPLPTSSKGNVQRPMVAQRYDTDIHLAAGRLPGYSAMSQQRESKTKLCMHRWIATHAAEDLADEGGVAMDSLEVLLQDATRRNPADVVRAHAKFLSSIIVVVSHAFKENKPAARTLFTRNGQSLLGGEQDELLSVIAHLLGVPVFALLLGHHHRHHLKTLNHHFEQLVRLAAVLWLMVYSGIPDAFIDLCAASSTTKTVPKYMITVWRLYNPAWFLLAAMAWLTVSFIIAVPSHMPVMARVAPILQDRFTRMVPIFLALFLYL